MLPAIPNPFVQLWFNWYCRHALRKFFHRVHLFGDVRFDPGVSTLYVINHTCFWDVISMNFLIQSRRRQPAYVMADLVQVQRHPFFRRVGAFSVDRAHPRDGMRAIQYAADRLNASPCAVAIFPQGMILPADKPLAFEGGVERLIARSPESRIVVVAFRYEFWIDQRAELLIDLSDAADRSVDAIQSQMAARLELLKAAGRHYRAGSQILLTGRRSIG